jgi:hypothetical protein
MRKPGCLGGLFQLAMVTWVFDFLQGRFGFGKGASCSGFGCGCIMLVIFLAVICSIVTGTNWLKLF